MNIKSHAVTIKSLCFAVAVLLFAPTLFAADKTILIELRVPNTVDASHGSIEFVGEHTSQGVHFKDATQTVDGNTNVFQRSFIIYTSLYRERRFAVVVWPGAPPKMMAQVFALPIGPNPKPTTDWSKWQRPKYIEDSKHAGDDFMDDVKSPDISTNIPPDCFEMRYKIQ